MSTKVYHVKGPSMNPAITEGQYVWVWNGSGVWNPQSGHIVALENPIPEDSVIYIKRVVGQPGDTLHISDKHIEIRDKSIPHDPVFGLIEMTKDPALSGYADYIAYLLRWVQKQGRVTLLANDTLKAVIIPEGYYFVAGDNHSESMDSRFWGLVAKDRLKGRVIRAF